MRAALIWLIHLSMLRVPLSAGQLFWSGLWPGMGFKAAFSSSFMRSDEDCEDLLGLMGMEDGVDLEGDESLFLAASSSC